MRNKYSGHKYFSDFGEGCEGILSVSERHGQIPDDGTGERQRALAKYLSDPNSKSNQDGVAYHVYRKHMDKKTDLFFFERNGLRLDGRGADSFAIKVIISDHAMLRMDERCIDKRLLKSRIKQALYRLRQASGEVSWALGKGKDARLYLRDYKKIMSMQGSGRFVIYDKDFKLVFESKEIKEVRVGTGSAPVFFPKNGKVFLELVSIYYDKKRLSPISDTEIMQELAINTKRQDCIDELRRDRVRLHQNQRGESPDLEFEVRLPNSQTVVALYMAEEDEEALTYLFEAHKKHIADYLLKADTYFGLGENSRASEMLDEDEIAEAVSPYVVLNVMDTTSVGGVVFPTEIMVEVDPVEYQKCLNELYEEDMVVKSVIPKKFASETFSALSDEEKEEVYDKWHDLINMSQSSLNDWAEDEDRLLASINREEAKDAGNIQSGYDSFHRIKRRKEKPFEDWSSDDFTNAKQEIGFNSRMLGGKPGQPVEDTGMSKWEISLKNWGHDPSLKSSPQYEKWESWHNSHNTKKASIARVAIAFLNKRK
tara:strand:+ start:1031 stop:2647 length:1617 start_codon:yes stop_codon:yes gene_type:complete